MRKETPDFKKFIDEYIDPGVRRLIQDEVQKRLEEIKREIGYEEIVTYVQGRHQVRPRFSVDEKIKALAEFLKVEFTSEEPKPRRVIAVKK